VASSKARRPVSSKASGGRLEEGSLSVVRNADLRSAISPPMSAKICGERLPAHAIDRPRLIGLLDHDGWRVASVTAGAGTGKSVLVQQWIATLADNQHAVFALDNGDDQPEQFWRYLVASLQRARPNKFRRTGRLCARPVDHTEALIAPLLEDASALDRPLVLVLEDLHNIGDESILTALAALVERLPEPMRIVFTSRRDVALPVARWRARSWLVDIRSIDLAFDLREAAQLFEALGEHRLSTAELGRLVAETEGWVAALQLLAVAMQQNDVRDVVANFSGRTRIIADFLGSEIIEKQTDEMREFMTAISVADTVDPELCEALTGRTDSAVQLRALEANTHFLVAIDDQQLTYRYHHLLQDVLRADLAHQTPKQTTRLHGIVAEVLEGRSDIAGAVQHLVAAGEYDRAFELALVSAYEYWDRGNIDAIATTLSLLPVDALDERPHRMVVYAFALGLCGRFNQALVWLDRVCALAAEREPTADDAAWVDLLRLLALSVDGTDRDGIASGLRALERVDSGTGVGPLRDRSRENLARAYLLSDDVASARAALAASRGSSASRQVLYLGLSARAARREGLLGAAMDYADRALTAAASFGLPKHFVAIDAYLALVGVLIDRNDLSSVAAPLADIHEILETFPSTSYLVLTALEEARLAAARDGVNAGLACLAGARDATERRDRHALRRLLDILEARLRLEAGETRAVGPLLARLAPSDERDLLRARLMLAENRPADARAALDAVTFSNVRDRLGAQLLRVQAAVMEGADVEPALAHVVELAAAERFVGAILAEGPLIARLIRQCAEGSGTVEAERLALELGSPPRRHAPAQSALVVPLSERERDVLRFLPSRLTTRQIAAECFMSVNTVKAHLKGIYSKLGVATRADAVERARMLGELHIQNARTG